MEDTPVLSIIGEKVALGCLCKEHIPLYQRWMNNYETGITYFRGDLRLDTREQFEERYQNMSKDVYFTLYERASLRPIGLSNLWHIDHYNRTADFGIIIGDKADRGKGYGTEATRLTLDAGFTGLGLHNILLDVFSYNHAGIGAYTRAGFKVIGRRREAKRLAGKAYDLIYMDCLATEFQGSVLQRLLPAE